MADLSVFSNIEMRDEHMKLLEMNANTFWDYIAHEDFGTTRIFPKEDQHLLDGFKWITGQSVIYYLDLNVLVVRFPIVGILGIIGFIVGIRGYFTFSKYSTTLCLSFLYFSGMCSTAALLHSFVPFSYIYFRWWLTYLDLLQDYFLGIGYLSVFVSSSYTVCVSSLCKEMDRDLWKIGMFGAVIFGMMVLFMYLCPMLCPLTNGKFNVGIVAMGATTFGFIIVQHYASKFYERKQKTE
eukprot:204868_1